MLGLYKRLTKRSGPVLRMLLKKRLARGKEDKDRIGERMGRPSAARPEGRLVWVHAASVGEAQSALILINALMRKFNGLRILVTTGTVTSAKLMGLRLPEGAFHQYFPLDHPDWTGKFIEYWRPDAVYWMESELWPNMLHAIREKNIPATLVNGHLSERSYRRWRRAHKSISGLLASFERCLVQTATDERYFLELGAKEVIVTDNLKYSALPLPCDNEELKRLAKAVGDRPVWLYASTHEGEETMACRLHDRLSEELPGLLTILVPRHPERGKEVMDICLDAIMNARRRSEGNDLPAHDDDIYIADTLGELGLFYNLSHVACIGRTFSKDGGGHNPVEAAQLGCAVLHGPLVQNLREIFSEMDEAKAAIQVNTEKEMEKELHKLLTSQEYCRKKQEKAAAFADKKASVIDTVMLQIAPRLQTRFEDLKK